VGMSVCIDSATLSPYTRVFPHEVGEVVERLRDDAVNLAPTRGVVASELWAEFSCAREVKLADWVTDPQPNLLGERMPEQRIRREPGGPGRWRYLSTVFAFRRVQNV
jgi:hypothetical protein